MFKHIYIYILPLLALAGCIKNDIPYPYDEVAITSVVGDGFTTKSIDNITRTVTIELEEVTNIKSVNISSVEYSDPAVVTNVEVVGVHNFLSPLYVTLLKYQKFDWAIEATQPIERYFKVEGQLDELIDEKNRSITAYVTKDTDLTNIKITKLKLGPEGITTTTPELTQLVDFTDTYGNPSFRRAYISYHDIVNQSWRLYVVPTDVSVAFTTLDLWATKGSLRVAGDTSGEYGIRYRRTAQGSAPENEWIEIPAENLLLDSDGGSFSTTLNGLESETSYQFIAYCGGDYSVQEQRTTEAKVPLINGDFESWSYSRGGTSGFLQPWGDGDTPYWSSGNEGSAIGGKDLTTPVSDPRPASAGNTAAQLKSQSIVGKFAAGNLFIGSYLKTAGTSGGIVGFGRPFVTRPTALRGWVKYNCGIVDKLESSPAGDPISLGSKDVGMIYVALGTWTPEEYGQTSKDSDKSMWGTTTIPVIVDTRDRATLFDPHSEAVVGYGELVLGDSQQEWMEFEIPIDYNSTTVVPTHLILVCSASRYGDYFAGSTSSCMWVDDFELVY